METKDFTGNISVNSNYSLQEFLNLPEVPCQRNTEARLGKARKYLKKVSPEHCIVHLVRLTKDCEVAGLSRANLKDIDRAWEAIKCAANPRIHTFIATSDIHLKHKLKKTKDEVLEIIGQSVRHSAKYTSNVEFILVTVEINSIFNFTSFVCFDDTFCFVSLL